MRLFLNYVDKSKKQLSTVFQQLFPNTPEPPFAVTWRQKFLCVAVVFSWDITVLPREQGLRGEAQPAGQKMPRFDR